MTPTPALEAKAQTNRPFLRVSAWSLLAAVGGSLMYSVFTLLTGLEESLMGIPVGISVGRVVYYASGRFGGRRFQILAVLLAFVAFDLTYAPGMAGVAFRHGITFSTFGFFILTTTVSPVIDAQNGFPGQFMVTAGMYLAWTLVGTRKVT